MLHPVACWLPFDKCENKILNVSLVLICLLHNPSGLIVVVPSSMAASRSYRPGGTLPPDDLPFERSCRPNRLASGLIVL